MKGPLRWVLIAVVVLMILVAGGSLTGYFMLKHYLAGDDFRKSVEKEASKYLEIPVTFSPFQWTGFSVYSDQLQTVGTSRVALKTAQAGQIRADFVFRSLFKRVLRIEQIEVQTLSLEFQTPPPPEPTPSIPSEPPPTPPPAWVKTFLPQEVEIGTVYLRSGNVTWPAGEKSIGQLSNLKLDASPDGRNLKNWKVQVDKGTLQLPSFPSLNLQKLKGRIQESDFFVTEAILNHQGEGIIAISGDIHIGEPAKSNLAFDIEQLPITPFLPEDWRAKLVGRLYGKLQMEQSEKTNGERLITGPIELKQSRLEALPALEKIAEYTKTQRWRRIDFDHFKGQLRWTSDKTQVDQIEIESRGLVRVEGTYTQIGNEVSSLLQVGSTPEILQNVPGLYEKLFTDLREPYAYTPVRLSGTTPNIKNDLTERLLLAVGSALIENIPQNLQEGAKSIGETLKGGAQGVLDFFKK